MNISELLARQARKYPNKEAIISGGDRISYSEWDRNVNKLANALSKRGIGKGDKVVLHMPNVTEFLYTYFAMRSNIFLNIVMPKLS